MVGLEKIEDTRDPDARVFLHGLSWWQFESMLAIRGDQAGPRLAFLEGTLELMSPSQSHEGIKTMLARLVEAYAEEAGVTLNGYGSLTMRNPSVARAAEPDECYVVGGGSGEPNLVIEVIWTSGGLDKRRLYAGLGVAELWEWRHGQLQILTLHGDTYVAIARSALLPGLDPDVLVRFVSATDQTAAVRAFRKALREPA